MKSSLLWADMWQKNILQCDNEFAHGIDLLVSTGNLRLDCYYSNHPEKEEVVGKVFKFHGSSTAVGRSHVM